MLKAVHVLFFMFSFTIQHALFQGEGQQKPTPVKKYTSSQNLHR